MRVDDAWYSGDRGRIARLCGEEQATTSPRRGSWNRRREQPRRPRSRLHVPLPSDIASTSADLLFGDMPVVKVTDTTTQDRLDALLDEGQVQQILHGGAEQGSALSGVYLRATWDRALIDRPILSVVQPDNVAPEFRWGMLRAATLWRELSGSTASTVFRHVERHEPGHILHGLYEGTPDNLGRAVPLSEHTETADLVDGLSNDGVTVDTGIRDLTVAYVPNIGPNRLHRSSPVGRSDFQGIRDLFTSLDDVWTSWLRDIRLARARLIVPDGYLRDYGPGQGSAFDDDREVWHSLRMPPTEGNGITLSQFAIRVEEHQRSAEALMRQAAQSAGYSAQSFGLDGGGQPITATEVDSRDARSMVTRRKKVGYWRHPLAHVLHVMLQLDAVHFGRQIAPERPRVEFGDGVAESEQTTATTLDLLTRAGAVSTATKVRWLHPTWEDEQVDAEVAAILRETGAADVADPGGTYPLAA
ncbi:phage capsid protein [Streptomyces sp. KR2]|uniref:phage capsid protein n=1 Tax=Streptomyces sp. KR2 TaxID=1514824 RepID=UPI00366551B0